MRPHLLILALVAMLAASSCEERISLPPLTALDRARAELRDSLEPLMRTDACIRDFPAPALAVEQAQYETRRSAFFDRLWRSRWQKDAKLVLEVVRREEAERPDFECPVVGEERVEDGRKRLAEENAELLRAEQALQRLGALQP